MTPMGRTNHLDDETKYMSWNKSVEQSLELVTTVTATMTMTTTSIVIVIVIVIVIFIDIMIVIESIIS